MYTMNLSGTKWDIFLAALDLFSREGYHNVSMAQIATAAGIRASSIYNHFPCKDALLEAMYDYYNECAARSLPPLEALCESAASLPPFETLRRVAPATDSSTERILSQILAVATGMHGDVRAKMLIHNNMFQTPRRYLTRLLEQMVADKLIEPLNVEAFVFVYCSVRHSVSMRSIGPYDGPDWPSVAEELLEHYITVEKERAAG